MIVDIHRRNSYPFKDISAGEKFFVENYSPRVMNLVATAGNTYYKWKNRPLRIKCEREGDGFWAIIIKLEEYESGT